MGRLSKIAVLCMPLIVVGCNTPTESKLAVFCNGVAGTIKSATELRIRGELSDSQIDAINKLISATRPICGRNV